MGSYLLALKIKLCTKQKGGEGEIKLCTKQKGGGGEIKRRFY